MPTVAELLEAVPRDVASESSATTLSEGAGVADAMHHLTSRPIPVGSLQRLWSLGGLQARLGVAYFAWWVRQYFRNSDRSTQDLLDTHLRSAIDVLETMGYLRGAIMKIGQMGANLPQVVPDAFADTLRHLHFEAPPMHYSLLREYVRDELGGDPEDLFAEFNPQAFAAASLGQVHSARLKSGQRVAVKIQYPGIARTIDSDFKTLFAIFTPLRFTADWENLKSQFEEIRQVLLRETDYELEAENLRTARAQFTEADGILVPEVIEACSTQRILTMEYLDGQHLDAFLQGDPPQELRNHFGAQIFRACTRLHCRARMHYADPHPGNFLFLEDGRLGFIDFGCIRRWNDTEWEYMRLANEALQDYSREAIAEHIRRGVDLTEEQLNDPKLMDLMVDYCRWIWEPMVRDEEYFCGDPEWIRRGVDIAAEFTRHARPAQKPLNVFIQRAFWAAWGVHYRLGSRFNAKRILDQELENADWFSK